MTGLTELLVSFAVGTLEMLGYAGLFVLMALESMVAPVPSEAVMPFAGFLVVDRRMDLGLAIAASSAGSVVGSLAGYAMGFYLGRPAILRFGRYLLLREEHLHYTERLFLRHGESVILAARFVPVVRHLISIPAGMGEMRLSRFVLFTLVGATLWNLILLYVGMQLREGWRQVTGWFTLLDYAIAAGLVALIAYWIVAHFRDRRRRTEETS